MTKILCSFLSSLPSRNARAHVLQVMMHGIGVDILEEDSVVIILRNVPHGPGGEAYCKKFGIAAPDLSWGWKRCDVQGGFFLKVKDPETTVLRAIYSVDPKVPMIPSWGINYFCKNFGHHLVHMLQKQLTTFDKKGLYVSSSV